MTRAYTDPTGVVPMEERGMADSYQFRGGDGGCEQDGDEQADAGHCGGLQCDDIILYFTVSRRERPVCGATVVEACRWVAAGVKSPTASGWPLE